METRKGNQNYRSFLWYREIGFGEGKGNRFPPMANQWKNAIRGENTKGKVKKVKKVKKWKKKKEEKK